MPTPILRSAIAIFLLAGFTTPARAQTVALFNGKDLAGWDTHIMGLGDANPGAFTVVDGLLKIAGGAGDKAWYGGLITREKYNNYKLVVEYKWGQATYGERKGKARDSGVLFHCVGPLDKNLPYMTSYEAQIIEGGMGDILTVNSPPYSYYLDDAGQKIELALKAEARKLAAPTWGQEYIFAPGSPVIDITGQGQRRVNWWGRDPQWKDVAGFRGPQDLDAPLGEWNRMELVCEGDGFTITVNGKPANKATGLNLTSGKILIQTEGAEISFRKIELTPLPPKPAAHRGPLTPDEAVRSFRLEEGLKIQPVAAEPLVVDPVAIAWDEKGRMYVAEDRGYPTGLADGKPAGVVARLEDTDGDGIYDKRTEFATGLTFPNGVMCWKGGVLVTCAPDIFYLRDNDGDGVADEKRVVLTGFSTQQSTQLRTAFPTLGIDGWIYITSGLTGGKVSAPDSPKLPPVESGGDFRFKLKLGGLGSGPRDPGSSNVNQPSDSKADAYPIVEALEPAGARGQFGLSFDDFGRRFVCSNRNPAQHVVITPGQAARVPWLPTGEGVQDVAAPGEAAKVYQLTPDETAASFHPTLINTPHAGTFTSACGVLLFRSAVLGEDHLNNLFICEPAQNLVQRQVMSPAGATFTSRRPYEGRDFLASTDSWFRPVFAASGPEGALYICDMYRGFIDHPDYIPKEAQPKINFRAGDDKGRIYRITRATSTTARSVRDAGLATHDVAAASPAQLCTHLDSPNPWLRDTARRLLIERADPASVEPLRKLVKEGHTPAARAVAFRTLGIFAGIGDAQIETVLHDPDPAVREQAAACLEDRLTTSDPSASAWLNRIAPLADDPSPRVRFAAAMSLAAAKSPQAIPALVRIAAQSPDDSWSRIAILGGVTPDPMAFAKALTAQTSNPDAPAPYFYELGRMFGANPDAARAAEFFTWATGGAATPTAADAAAAGLAEGLRSRGTTLTAWADAFPAAKAALVTLPDRWTATALNAQSHPQTRLRATALIGERGFEKSGPTLTQLLAPARDTDTRTAAVRALGRMTDPAAGQALVSRDHWTTYTPALREAAIAALMSNLKQLPALLTAVERGDVPIWALNPTLRNQLLNHGDPAIKARAQALLQTSAVADRQKVYEEHKTILALKPDGKTGHEVFLRICSACHTHNGEGHAVGPDLTGLRNQPAETLLLHIIIPDYEIYPTYTQYLVQTKDGRTLNGLIASETPAALTLRLPLGQQETLQRTNIASVTALDYSLMPRELEKAMTRQELANLIGFLKGQ